VTKKKTASLVLEEEGQRVSTEAREKKLGKGGGETSPATPSGQPSESNTMNQKYHTTPQPEAVRDGG